MRRGRGQVPAWTLPLLVALLAPWGPLVAVAADDGGSVSVFAHGAGNRALALGGAYAAVADDAASIFWNPAGLARVPRRELWAGHSNLIGLGFGEQAGALALPHWRWGTVALAFRRFGVDGIDARDEHNVAAGELTDAESELALGLARELGPAWSIGGALKLRRQDLAGFSDSGWGCDLGLLARPLLAAGVGAAWARDLKVGLSLRNAVEPAIRLDEETVADPFAWRLGLALARPVGWAGRLLVASDVEKSRDRGARFHAGVELQPLPELALRAGVNDGLVTAGTGLRWDGVGADYAFEDNPLGAVHRFGVSLAFGPTVVASRQAALAAQEDALQARLANAFESRRRAQADSLAAQARAALAAGRWEGAVALVEQLRVLEPEGSWLAGLESAAWRGRGRELAAAGDYAAAELALERALAAAPDDSAAAAALARTRAESDRRAARTAEVRALFAAALDAFAADSLSQARDGFTRLLALAPEDAEAAAMLRRTETALAVRQAQAAARAAPAASTRGTDEGGAAGAAAGGGAAGGPARAGSGPARGGEAAAPPAGRRPELSETRRRELADLYRRGVAAVEAGRSREAVGYWEIVWAADPGHQRVGEYLKREYLTQGMEAFAAGSLDEAVRCWEKALRVDPGDKRAAGYLERARQQRARIEQMLGSAR